MDVTCSFWNLQKCLSKAFIPVIRSLWPGINDSTKRSPTVVAIMRKRAVQASRFMLQMMQAPLYKKENLPKDGNGIEDTKDGFAEFESGEEGLAIRIAAEVINSISDLSGYPVTLFIFNLNEVGPKFHIIEIFLVT